MSRQDESTSLMPKDELASLITRAMKADQPPTTSHHTIPRVLVDRRAAAIAQQADEGSFMDETVSPLAVFAVLAVLIGLFVAIVQL